MLHPKALPRLDKLISLVLTLLSMSIGHKRPRKNLVTPIKINPSFKVKRNRCITRIDDKLTTSDFFLPKESISLCHRQTETTLPMKKLMFIITIFNEVENGLT